MRLWLTDANSVAFFERSVDAPGELQCAEAYMSAIRPSMQRDNTIGVVTDDPNVMTSCRKMVKTEFKGAVTSACHWHKTDHACPLDTPTVKKVLQDSAKVYRWFKNRGVPLGCLRKERE